MNNTTIAAVALGFGVALGGAGPVDRAAAQEQQQPIYGRQLMTEQERTEYRARMRAATSAEEREQIRREHHARMQERAREQGVDLPEMPRGGMGQGMGAGRGQGGGMGQGGGGGRR